MRTIELDQYWPGAQNAGVTSKLASRVGAAGEPQSMVDNPSVPLRVPGPSDGPAHVIADRRDRRTPIIWGSLGFFAGMFAWHLIGFWSFVSNVAFNDDQRVTAAANGGAKIAVPLRKSKPVANGNSLASIHAGNCIALEIDRTSGDAKPGNCPVDEKPLADAGRTRRDDLAFSRPRLQDPQIWTDVTAVKSEVAAEAIDETSFDLTIEPAP